VTLARDVLARLIPFLRYVVAAHQADCPIAQEGETEPLGWWLKWRAGKDQLTVLTAFPPGVSTTERQEVLLSVAILPGVKRVGLKGKSSPHIAADLSVDPSDLSDLSDWLRRWHEEVEAQDW